MTWGHLERAYVDRIPTYTAPDDKLASVANAASSGLGAVSTAPPSKISAPADPANPQRFLTSPNPVCADWKAAGDQFNARTTEWANIGSDTPASQWTPEQRKISEDAAPVLSAFADKIEQLGRRSGNPTLEDFAVLSAQYRRAYVQSIPSYTPADGWLLSATNDADGTVRFACAAVGG